MESLRSNEVFSKSWQNDSVVEQEIKVEKLDEDLPVMVKAEKDINIDKLNDYSSEENTEYVIEESQNEVNFSLKSKPETTENKEEELLSTLKNSKCNEETIEEEPFIKSEIIVQEELDIKVEDEVTDEWPVGQHKPSNITDTLNRKSTSNRHFEPPVFKCLNCTYQTHLRQCITSHVLIHMKNTLKCPDCSYKTLDERAFRKHQSNHTLKKRHQCPECSYTSIRKDYLTQHMLKHTKGDDAIWYQCPECPYKTKYRADLTRRHMLTHRASCVYKVHKCSLCCYKGSRKSDLRKHTKVKHRPEDLPSIHCQEQGCSYKTYHEVYLARHIKVRHENNMLFVCSKCSYQTKYRTSLKRHELSHEKRNKSFSCTLCPYKTTNTYYLKKHMLLHESDSEIKWLECPECPFRTKRNSSLSDHKNLIHNLNPDKIIKCSKCSYKTVHARLLRNHDLVHKKPEDISEWFYCYLCKMKTPRKHTLVGHMQRVHNELINRT